MLRSMFRRSLPTEAAHALYAGVVAQARSPFLFREMQVPDTVDGRFEMVSLHAFLVLRRLKSESEATADLAQALFDAMFDDMDLTLREMGAGDMGVGKRVKAMVQAFYGRVAAYEGGLSTGGAGLADALRRNAFPGATPADASVQALARYVEAQDAHLSVCALDGLRAGELSFREVR